MGCDYHLGFQEIAFLDTETGDLNERFDLGIGKKPSSSIAIARGRSRKCM
jgi:hypothetical protein